MKNNKQINLRCDEQFINILNQAAKSLKISSSDFIRYAVLKQANYERLTRTNEFKGYSKRDYDINEEYLDKLSKAEINDIMKVIHTPWIIKK